MNGSARLLLTSIFSCAALAGLASLVAASLLSVSPSFHQRLHPGANRLDHNCIVTLVGSGHVHHSSPAVLAAAQIPKTRFSKPPGLNPTWVQRLFLAAGIFEHAPPTFV